MCYIYDLRIYVILLRIQPRSEKYEIKGSVSSVMCLEKVKTMVVPPDVVDLFTSDTHSRLYVSFMYLRNPLSFFTFILESPQRRIGTSALISIKNGGAYWLLWTYATTAWCSNIPMFWILAPGWIYTAPSTDLNVSAAMHLISAKHTSPMFLITRVVSDNVTWRNLAVDVDDNLRYIATPQLRLYLNPIGYSAGIHTHNYWLELDHNC